MIDVAVAVAVTVVVAVAVAAAEELEVADPGGAGAEVGAALGVAVSEDSSALRFFPPPEAELPLNLSLPPMTSGALFDILLSLHPQSTRTLWVDCFSGPFVLLFVYFFAFLTFNP